MAAAGPHGAHAARRARQAHAEHLGGARIRYIPPFTLFLNAVAVFFLFAVVTRFQLRDIVAQNPSWLAPMAEQYAAAAGLPVDAFIQRAERRFQGIYTLSLAIVSVAGYTLAYKAVVLALAAGHGAGRSPRRSTTSRSSSSSRCRG